MDGERLSEEDEKTVLEKLLAYHPHSEDKMGCGLNFIMVSFKYTSKMHCVTWNLPDCAQYFSNVCTMSISNEFSLTF